MSNAQAWAVTGGFFTVLLVMSVLVVAVVRAEIRGLRGEIGGARADTGTVRAEIGTVRESIDGMRRELVARLDAVPRETLAP